MKRLPYQTVDSKIQGYDTIKNDCSTGARGGVVFLVKHSIVINKEYRNIDKSLEAETELSVANA